MLSFLVCYSLLAFLSLSETQAQYIQLPTGQSVSTVFSIQTLFHANGTQRKEVDVYKNTTFTNISVLIDNKKITVPMARMDVNQSVFGDLVSNALVQLNGAYFISDIAFPCPVSNKTLHGKITLAMAYAGFNISLHTVTRVNVLTGTASGHIILLKVASDPTKEAYFIMQLNMNTDEDQEMWTMNKTPECVQTIREGAVQISTDIYTNYFNSTTKQCYKMAPSSC